MRDRQKVLLLSTSTVHGSGFLEYCRPTIADHFAGRDRILFIPYASPGGLAHDDYTDLVSAALAPVGIDVEGLHSFPNAVEAVREAEGLFTGGGNTFLLLRELYDLGLLEPIRERVAEGVPYMGSSAGSNVAGANIGTTNDMPIVYPPSFEALGLVPFNINPHYLDPEPDSTHMGETRETRIREFHVRNRQPVVGLREGAWLLRRGAELTLGGSRGGRLFRRDREAKELPAGFDLSELL
jgi:dipeptidase E